MLGLKDRLAKQAIVATEHGDCLPGRLPLPQSGHKLAATTAGIPAGSGQSTSRAPWNLITEFNAAAVTEPVSQYILPHASTASR